MKETSLFPDMTLKSGNEIGFYHYYTSCIFKDKGVLPHHFQMGQKTHCSFLSHFQIYFIYFKNILISLPERIIPSDQIF